MSIRYKFMIPILSTTLVVTLIMLFTFLSSFRGQVDRNVEKIFALKSADIEIGIQRVATDALHHASLFSQQPDVIQAYTMAMTGNIDDPADPMVHQARLFLREKMQPYLKGFSTYTGETKYKLHFHLPNGRSFLRVWRKTQSLNGKDDSDDISSFRHTVLEINSGTHAPISGIEIGRGGFAIRGLAPVTDKQGNHLGSVEMLYSFDHVTKNIKSDDTQDFAVYMNRKYLQIARSLQDSSKHPVVGDKYIFVYGTNRALAQERVSPALLDEGRKGITDTMEAGDYKLRAFPIRDYKGNQIGVFALMLNIRSQKAIIKRTQIAMSLMILFMLAVVGAVVIFISSYMVRPIRKLDHATALMAEGDIRTDIEIRQQDELGQLAQNFNTMLEQIRDSIRTIAENASSLDASSHELASASSQMASGAQQMNTQAQAAASATETVTENITTISTSAERVAANVDTVAVAAGEMSQNINTIAAAVEETSQSVSTVAGAAEQTSSNINAVVARFEEMSSSVHTIAAAIEEMTSSVGEVSKNCVQASKMSQDANGQAQSTAEVMAKLSQSAQQIGKVVDVINDIADQTKMLALNAAIEAAGAGEAGKEFAVVANEVKELAKQTAEATDQIASQINTMQRDTNDAVEAIGKIGGIIGEIDQVTHTITANMEEQSSATNEIARSMSGVAEGVGESSQRAQEVRDATEEVARSIGEAACGVNEIARSSAEAVKAAGEVAQGSATASKEVNEIARNSTDASKGASETLESVQGISAMSEVFQETSQQQQQMATQLLELAVQMKEIVGRFTV